mmetsp:Transcript_80069/g.183447  ORF Transcript_80069/g.183447 Transcript_80069/m.183447 type:complete len:238 (+) Transcript_80069:648-1361(+)
MLRRAVGRVDLLHVGPSRGLHVVLTGGKPVVLNQELQPVPRALPGARGGKSAQVGLVQVGQSNGVCEEPLHLNACPLQSVAVKKIIVEHLLLGPVRKIFPKLLQHPSRVVHEQPRAGPKIHPLPRVARGAQDPPEAHRGLRCRVHPGRFRVPGVGLPAEALQYPERRPGAGTAGHDGHTPQPGGDGLWDGTGRRRGLQLVGRGRGGAKAPGPRGAATGIAGRPIRTGTANRKAKNHT